MITRGQVERADSVRCGICGLRFGRLEAVRHRLLHTDAEWRGLKERWEKGVFDAYKIRREH